jgi:HNH endonuclease
MKIGDGYAFVSKSGRRCNERAFIEFDHVDPHGVGGEATVGNIRLLCRTHNAYESELFYGHGRRSGRRTLPGKSRPRPTMAVTRRGEATTN